MFIDYLSENNPKVREKSEDMLKTLLSSDRFDFNEGLTLILSKGSKINKAITRYNHSKLTFLVDVIEKETDSPIKISKGLKKSSFPVSLFLDFVDKSIVKREKVLNKIIREKVEKAIWIAYTKSNFDGIKDYVNDLDEITYINLSQKIPELKPKTPEVQTKTEETKEETSPPKSQQIMYKDKLKNIKVKKSFKGDPELEISGVMTDVEKTSKNKIEKFVGRIETRNHSIDRIREETDSIIDKQTEKLKDKIRKNLEAMRMSDNKEHRSNTRELQRSQQRTITPLKSRNHSKLDMSRKEISITNKSGIKEEKHEITPNKDTKGDQK